MRARPFSVLALGLFALLGVTLARAQDDVGDGDSAGDVAAQPDSIATAIWEAAAARGDTLSWAQVDSIIAAASGDEDDQPAIPTASLGLHPVFSSDAKAVDTRIEVNNDMRISAGFPSTWTVDGRIYYDRTLPREFTKEGVDKGFTLSTGKRLLGAVPIRLSADRSYKLDEQNKGESNYRRDVTEQQSVGVTASGEHELTGWLTANMLTSARLANTQAQNNQSLDRSSEDLSRQLAGHLDLAPAKGLSITAGYSGLGIGSSASLNDISMNVGTSQDSLQLRAEYAPSAAVNVKASGGRMERRAESLDFKRNQYGVVDPDSIPVFDVTRDTDVVAKVSVQLKPSDRLSFTGSAGASRDERRVRLEDNKNKAGDSSDFSLYTAFKLWKGFSADASYKQGESHSVDFAADKRQLKREFLTEASQALTKTFVLSGEAYLLLTQDEYADGKQDRDKAQTRVSGTVAGDMTPWMGASTTVQYFQNQDVRIPSTNSIASKDRNSLSWRADLDYTFRNKYKVTQRCEVSVTEEDFYFTQDKNALTRDYLLLTSTTLPVSGRIQVKFEHEFRKRETGSYLPDPDVAGHPKTFFKDSRTKTELLRLALGYSFWEYLSLSCDEEVGRDVDFDYRNAEQQVSIYGTLNFSMRFKYALGPSGKVEANLAHRARFGSFVRESQRSLWLPTLSIGYTF